MAVAPGGDDPGGARAVHPARARAGGWSTPRTSRRGSGWGSSAWCRRCPGPGPPRASPRRREEFRAQRKLDQFVQSLDHLRVALCSGRDAWGRPRRGVLITSACGGEGKTTLAAQLAERCVNAGLLTLLIDADLRNPTLSRMFEMADSRGLRRPERRGHRRRGDGRDRRGRRVPLPPGRPPGSTPAGSSGHRFGQLLAGPARASRS